MSATKIIWGLFLIFGLASSLPIKENQHELRPLQDEPSSLLADGDFPIRLKDETSETADLSIGKDLTMAVNEMLGVDMDHAVNKVNSELTDAINKTDVVKVVNEGPTNTNYVVYAVQSNITMRNQIRPGMQVISYSVEITSNTNDDTFSGRLTVQVNIMDSTTREDPVMFYVRELDIDSVVYSLVGGLVFVPVLNFDVDEEDGILEIETGIEATLYTFVIEYRGSLSVPGQGLYAGRYDSL